MLGYANNVLIEGFIDMLYKEGEQWVIVDYKTDAHLSAETQQVFFNQLQASA
ncbi:MAG: PD-(D/E)XK nuclease family protein [Corynebacterium sp.]|nr:PD-(D/E)XK nuclease family protein [Corynebacterium sp.]